MQRKNASGSRADDAGEREAQDGPRPLPKADGLVLGELVELAEPGSPLVRFPGSPAGGAVQARSIAPLTVGDVGCTVALMFEGGDASRPVVLGKIVEGLELQASAGAAAAAQSLGACFKVEADGERLELRAEREIVLRVGDASITLTRAGKVLIRGAYVQTRSSGVNRIQGGSVQIN